MLCICDYYSTCIDRVCINILFLFLFEGEDDSSKSMAATIDNTAVSSKLESEDFVVIRINSGSEAYRQFTQICILIC
jgi:hypothetical protein